MRRVFLMKYAITVELEYTVHDEYDPTDVAREILNLTLSGRFPVCAEHYHLLGKPRKLDEEPTTERKAIEAALANPELLDSVRAFTNEELKQQFVEATVGIVSLKDEINRRDEEARRTEEDAGDKMLDEYNEWGSS